MTELIALVVGAAVGRYFTLAIEKERLVFERRVELVSDFLWKASRYTFEHIAGVDAQPKNVGKEKQELVRLSHQARLLVPEKLDGRIADWIDDYVRALAIVSDEDSVPGASPISLARDLHDDLTELRNDLKDHISGAWLMNRIREWGS